MQARKSVKGRASLGRGVLSLQRMLLGVLGLLACGSQGLLGGGALPLITMDANAAGEWDAQERAGRLTSAEGDYYVWAEAGETLTMRMAISPKNHSASAVIPVKWTVSLYAAPDKPLASGEAKLTLADSNAAVAKPLNAAEGDVTTKEEMLDRLKYRVEFTAPEAGIYLVQLKTKGVVQIFMEDEFQARPWGVVAALPGEDRGQLRQLPSWPNVPTYFYIPQGVSQFTVIVDFARNPSFALKITNSVGTSLFESPEAKVGEFVVKNPDPSRGAAFSLKASSLFKIAIPEAAPFFAKHPRNLAAVEPL